MTRYIDADAAEKQIVDYYDAQLQSFPSSRGEEKRLLLGGINYGRNVVRDAPTADVAPKPEVARGIFEEIENLSVNTVDDWGNSVQIISEIDYAELKKEIHGCQGVPFLITLRRV